MDFHNTEMIDVLGLQIGTFRCETGEILVSVRDILEQSMSDVNSEVAFLKSEDGVDSMRALRICPASGIRNGMYEEGLYVPWENVNHYMFNIREPGIEIDVLRQHLSAEIAKHWERLNNSAAGYTPQQLRKLLMFSADEKLYTSASVYNIEDLDGFVGTIREFIRKELGLPVIWDNMTPMQMDVYNTICSLIGSVMMRYKIQEVDLEQTMELVYADIQQVIQGFARTGCI